MVAARTSIFFFCINYSTIRVELQFVKSLRQFTEIMGAFGLFVIWLLVMMPLVLVLKVVQFLKLLVFSIFNLVRDGTDIFLAIIRTLADLFIPW